MTDSDNDRAGRFAERAMLLGLAAVQFTHILDFMIMMPLGPKFMREFGISPERFGVLLASYSFSAGIAGFLAGFYLDRFERRRVLVTLYAGFTLGTLGCALAGGYWSLMAARVVAGAFGGVAGSVVLAIVGDAVAAERRGRAMGLIMTAFSLASVLGMPVGLSLADRFGWNAPFFVLAACGLAVLAVISRVVPVMPAHAAHSAQGALKRMGAILREPNHRRAFALMAVVTGAGALIYPFMSPSLVFNAGLPEDRLALVYLCGGAATIVTSNFFGRLSDRLGRVRVFSAIVLMSAPLTLGVTHLPPTPVWAILALTTCFVVSTAGRMVPMMAILSTSVEPRHRGGFMSVNSAVQQLSGGLATALAGALVSRGESGRLEGYGYAGWLSVACVALSVLLVRRVRPVAQ